MRSSEEVASNPSILLKLSELAVASAEAETKWQLAYQLGSLSNQKEQAEAILLHFVTDADEYVSRRALLALGVLESSQAEKLAVRAWDTGYEYQRIATLSVLRDTESAKLAEYVTKALKDGREYLVQNAHEVEGT
ncbi:hypothetical protein [Candidatus Cyanaurora vandensis]|uniref:hypothetical protein n=1 Tax=Candidatus Cyanaurora vandensis TaxID=2714958 RepID=UPI00257A9571|nr:hypothetical protein [Candidatus Cyanaurora vandensis]